MPNIKAWPHLHRRLVSNTTVVATPLSWPQVFEYFVDPKQRQWVAWETKLSAAFKPAPDTPFFKIMVCAMCSRCLKRLIYNI